MYLTLSPFFYYLANQQYIEDFITLESDGKSPQMLCYGKLKYLVDKYIQKNSHGVDEHNIEKYSEYICKHLTN